MRKHYRLLEYALSSLLRRKYKNFALSLIYALLVSVLSSVMFLTHSLKNEALNVFTDAPELIVQRLSGGRHDLIPLKYVGLIEAIPGVAAVQPRYWGYYYDSLTGGNYTIMARTTINTNLNLLTGTMPQEGQCAVGKGVAQARQLDINDAIFFTLGSEQKLMLDVVGIFTANSSVLTNDLVVLDKNDFMRFFAMDNDKATDLMVSVSNEHEIDTIANKIRRTLPDTRPITRSEILRTYENVFNWRGGMALLIFCATLLAFFIFAWDKATGLSAEERQEIGILKAIGWETSDVLTLKFWEAMVVSFTSFLGGVSLGYVHVFYFGGTIFEPFLKGWSVMLPPFDPIPYIDIYQVVVIFFLTVVPYLASTIIPSWKAAIADPDTIMRT
ncbi:MAG: FtsX-like permease family protein [Candidatus Magnetobacterium sp. LHC-1]|uniref:FtsX-like permease family protein n=1 Tax=Candidatus Magnetobacterium casense TaxID=1455061 RepID=A0ABS6RYD2_9BACT|nr:FtsX-like permease family protein [Candidatus Magnetobacterium casensis]MBF0608540.1 FtsX-like permease family protein [Nitrospirota bacterium]MBV6341616.1 FtsX-like permease family protein [Candidatus Magnetobacterium casensis]